MNRRYFVLSFAAAFMVMTVMAMIAVHFLSPDIDLDTSGPSQEADGYTPVDDDTLTVLMVGTSASGESAGAFVLLQFRPVEQRIWVTCLPPQTTLDSQARHTTLAGAYERGGGAYARLALSEAYQLGIDRYVVVDQSNFSTIMELLGPVDFYLTNDIRFTNGEREIKLYAGIQRLDGTMITDIVSFDDFPGGEVQRCETTSELVIRVINDRLELAKSVVIDALFNSMINRVETDITHNDYIERRDALIYMARLTVAPATAVYISGDFNESAEFVLSGESSNRLSSIFGVGENS